MLIQRQIPTIKPLTTAHLAQTMTLLELSAVELRQKVESELAQNPALELVEENRCPTCRRLLHGARRSNLLLFPKQYDQRTDRIFIIKTRFLYTKDIIEGQWNRISR
jgi:RNA polymerase sigma-54 factor